MFRHKAVIICARSACLLPIDSLQLCQNLEIFLLMVAALTPQHGLTQKGIWQKAGNLCTSVTSHVALFLTTSARLAASLSGSFCPGFTHSSRGAPAQQPESPKAKT